MKEEIQLPDFSDLHILVIGDVMLDRYLTGNVFRISPEAPVPILDFQNSEDRPGGAANVAINITALGAKVTLAGIIGKDSDGSVLNDLLSDYGISGDNLLSFKNRQTTTKTRIMSGSQHLLRVDREDKTYLSSDDEALFMKMLNTIIQNAKPSGIILQDYNKGVLTGKVIRYILKLAGHLNIPTFVDPKKQNFLEYEGCTVFKPNKAEITGTFEHQADTLDDLDALDQMLRSSLHHKISFITLSKDGIYISDGNNSAIIPAEKRRIVDVCGAGDTVLSVLSLCYVKKLDLKTIAIIANIAGGQVCSKPGVVAINSDELKSELKRSI
jgi:D-glycero-beta-D-manno-heptose-7-phosphate kinase